jgi:hypothetical protein
MKPGFPERVMGLMDLLRRAEEQSRTAARRGKEIARATLNESGRILRRKMRVNPPRQEPLMAGTPRQQERRPGGSSQIAQPAAPTRKKIISVNGQDVRTEEVLSPRKRSA